LNRENRAELPSEVFDAGAGDDSGAVAEEVWDQGWGEGGVGGDSVGGAFAENGIRRSFKGTAAVTVRSRDIGSVRKVVLFFDICGSTRILEDLVATESEHAWRDLLISLKEFMRARAEKYPLEVYKFLGDGWVLLFDQGAIDGKALLEFCRELADKYERSFKSRIRPRLQSKDYEVGLSFGADRGTLIRIIMNGQAEYIGRPLNVAARLQGAIRGKDVSPAGTLLISNAAYIDLGLGRSKRHGATEVSRTLKNVSFGQDCQVRRIVVFRPEATVVRRSKGKTLAVRASEA